MKDIEKRLVEVEYVLKRLDNNLIEKIPQEIWNYLSQNKDKNYVFKYDHSKTLAEQNLSIDTIALLTYINMQYLLTVEQKQEMSNLFLEAEMTEEKSKKYDYKEVFNSKKETKETKKDIFVVKRKKWYDIFLNMLKNIFKQNRDT